MGSGILSNKSGRGYRMFGPKIIRHEKRQVPSSSGTEVTYVVIVAFCGLVGRTKKKKC